MFGTARNSYTEVLVKLGPAICEATPLSDWQLVCPVFAADSVFPMVGTKLVNGGAGPGARFIMSLETGPVVGDPESICKAYEGKRSDRDVPHMVE